jgi:hypothetical protein
MAISTIKPQVVSATALGLLERDVVVPRYVWRDAGGDFRGAAGDAVTIRVPAYAPARTRALRSGAARTKDNLTERRVIVSLDTNVYKTVAITDENLTLDITTFSEQVVAPMVAGIARGIEDVLVSTIQGATYAYNVTLDPGAGAETATISQTFYGAAIRARRMLNNGRVPMADRVMIVGTSIEALALQEPQLVSAEKIGTTDGIREGMIGRIAGFDVIPVPALAPNEAYAFHRTAYVLSTRAPAVPASAPWGATQAWNGFAIRVVQALDPDTVVDNVHADVFVGANVVRDYGTLTGEIFTPASNPDLDVDTPLFVRAVKITLA